MNAHRAAWTRSAEEGFILPGVVMFVVVLTILGLSLFALSGYEGQFMNASIDKSEAFYYANGAIDRARYLLSVPPYSLQTVRYNLGPDVVYAVAKQGYDEASADSEGTVQWNNGVPIWIRAMARKNRDSSFVEAQFDPNWGGQPYDNLFSLSSTSPTTKGLSVFKGGTGWYANQETRLDGKLWQAWSGAGWDLDIFPLGPGPSPTIPPGPYDANLLVTLGAVPPPQVATFVTQNSPGAQLPLRGGNNFSLMAGPLPTFFRTPTPPGAQYSLLIDSGPPVNVNVSGIAVWLFNSGFRTDRTVSVTGSGMLVLCARAVSVNDPVFDQVNWGFGFQGGIQSTIPLIVVTDGKVIFESNPNTDKLLEGAVTSDLPWLTVFADDAYIAGPNTSHSLVFAHPSPSPAAEANLNTLIDQNALPNAAASRRIMAYRPGSWRVIQPNPN